jgi:hypothetical protein
VKRAENVSVTVPFSSLLDALYEAVTTKSTIQPSPSSQGVLFVTVPTAPSWAIAMAI